MNDSLCNGEVETAVKQLTGVLRTNKIDLEKRVGMSIPQLHPLMNWLVSYAAYMLTVRVVGPAGKTASERTRLKRFIKRHVPMGEVV